MRSLLTVGTILVAGMATLAVEDTPSAPAAERTVLKGHVVSLAEVLKEKGLAVDPAPVASQVVLKAESGEAWPLLLDDGSRALFADARLRNRPTRLEARKPAGLPYLLVLTFQVLEDGLYRTPEYWCEVCSISWRYDPELCPCCQGPMELRYKPPQP